MMTVLITITAGEDACSEFNLYSDVDYNSAFNSSPVTLGELVGGYTSYEVPDGTSTIKISPIGECVCLAPKYFDVVLLTTTTSTTEPPVTTSTTTERSFTYPYGYEVREYVDPELTGSCVYNGIRTIANRFDTAVVGKYYISHNGISYCIFQVLADSVDISGGGYLLASIGGAGADTCAELLPIPIP